MRATRTRPDGARRSPDESQLGKSLRNLIRIASGHVAGPVTVLAFPPELRKENASEKVFGAVNCPATAYGFKVCGK